MAAEMSTKVAASGGTHGTGSNWAGIATSSSSRSSLLQSSRCCARRCRQTFREITPMAMLRAVAAHLDSTREIERVACFKGHDGGVLELNSDPAADDVEELSLECGTG